MRIVKIISLIAFFVAVPFLGGSFLSDPPNLLPVAVVFAAIAGYAFTEAFNPAAPAGNRIRLLGFRVLFFAFAGAALIGLYRSPSLAA